MGQALSSCTRFCSGYEDEEFYQKATSNEKNPQWKEKIKTKNKIALDMNPKSAGNHLYFT